MTVYNWSEMTPRERDALVAEKVMGWTPNEDEKVWWTDSNGYLRWLLGEPKTGVWSPSTDISAAWEVVEKLNTERRPYCYVQVKIGAEMGGCEASVISHYKSDDLIAVAFCDTAPEAICLAALKAVGVDIQ